MKRIVYLLLALSLGLNAGMLYVKYVDQPERPHRQQGPPPGGQHQPPSPDRMINDHILNMTQQLDLNGEQQAAIREILAENMPVIADLMFQARQANQQISQAFAEPELDLETFNVLVRQASIYRAQADSVSAIMLVGEAAALTPEQRVKYAKVAPTIHSGPQRRQQPPRRRP